MEHELDTDSALSLGIDLGEVALDALLNEGILRDVPILGSLVNVVKVGRSVPDKLLALKVRRLLKALDKVKPAQRAALVTDALSCDEDRRAVGEIVVFALNAADSLRKAEYIGYLLCAYIEKKLSLGDFQYFVHAVNTSFINDVTLLLYFAKEKTKLRRQEAIPPLARTLVNSGLVMVTGASSTTGDGQVLGISEAGIKFCKVMLQYVRLPEPTQSSEPAIGASYPRLR